MTNYKINDSLYLSNSVFSTAEVPTQTKSAVNHIIAVDCSGSMSSDLPKIREQLKLKLPKLLGEEDTVSIIWFSGKDEFGTLIEGEVVRGLKDLSDINKAIDRWLKPVCLTGFKQPLESVISLTDKLSQKNKFPCSLFFITDGYDNQWPASSIIQVVEALSPKLSAATFVEYGYYCNRNLLSSMAEKAGGSLVFSEDFAQYEPVFDTAMTGKVGKPKVDRILPDQPFKDFVFSFDGGDIVLYSASNKTVSVPEDLREVWYLSENYSESPDDFGDKIDLLKPEVLKAFYACLALFGNRMDSNTVLSILRYLGDVTFINKYATCFGKQQYAEFVALAKSVAFGGNPAFQNGRDVNLVPKEDSFNIIELFDLIQSDPENVIVLDHEKFKYSKISRGRVDSSSVLTKAEQEEIQSISDKMKSEKNVAVLKDLQTKIDTILSSKKEALKFEETKSDGYKISSLTFNEERPNLSFLVRKDGFVDISSRIPSELGNVLPAKFPTHIFRNYNVVKDGLVNIEFLPVSLSTSTINAIQAEIDSGRCPKSLLSDDGKIQILNLRQIPVINRKMVKSVFAKDLFTSEFELIRSKAWQKVAKAALSELEPTKTRVSNIYEMYGESAAKLLTEMGITDGGFNPKMVQAESSDFYIGKLLDVKIKGYATLPSMKDLQVQIQKGKLNGPGTLMKEALDHIEGFKNSPAYQNVKEKNSVLKDFLSLMVVQEVASTRRLILSKAKLVFSIIIGQVWFNEFSSLDENSLKFKINGLDLNGTVLLKDIEIKI